MRKVWVFTLVAMTLAFPSAAEAAEGCEGQTFGTVTAGSGTARSTTYYVEDRGLGDLRVYEESNGIKGLQRGGVSDHHDDSACLEDPEIEPDTLVY